MGTNLRTELSKKNPYAISKHRRLELTHFCLQYPEWKGYLAHIGQKGTLDEWSDPTGEEAIKRVIFSEKMHLVEECCRLAGPEIYEYLLEGVTEGQSYVYLSTKKHIPCSKDYYYDKFHKFFYILSQK